MGHFATEFPYLLGSTNLCPTAAHMETFSTSVFKVTMASDTRFALQLVLVKRFKLHSFQLQDYKKTMYYFLSLPPHIRIG